MKEEYYKIILKIIGWKIIEHVQWISDGKFDVKVWLANHKITIIHIDTHLYLYLYIYIYLYWYWYWILIWTSKNICRCTPVPIETETWQYYEIRLKEKTFD